MSFSAGGRRTHVLPALLFISAQLALAAAPDAGCSECEVFASPKEAFAAVLREQPTVLAVGEYHELKSSPKVPSTLKRFTRDFVPMLKGQLAEVVVETWMVNGRCGEVEKKATKAVAKVTQRPDETEDELTLMLDATYRLGANNHILILDCDDYRSLLKDAGTLDAEASLLMVKEKVEEKARESLEKRDGGVVLLYGGAVHNDVQPLEEWKAYAFGPSLARDLGPKYLELDLLVPEYVVGDEDLVKELWFAPALEIAKTGKTVVVRPHAGSVFLVFPFLKRKR